MKQQRNDQLWHRIRGAVDGYAFGIVRLIGESYGLHTVQQAWLEFTVGAGDVFDGDDPHAELFFSWLFHRWSPTREKGSRVNDGALYGVPPTRAYLNRNSHRLDPLLRRYLETCMSTSPAFYEISDCKPNIGFRTRDVISGEEREVSEGLASTTLSDGDIMFGHLIAIDEATVLEAISPLSFPPVFKQRLIRLFGRQMSGESPESELRKLYFALTHPQVCQASARVH